MNKEQQSLLNSARLNLNKYRQTFNLDALTMAEDALDLLAADGEQEPANVYTRHPHRDS